MYLELDEGFADHPKTLRLCALMKCPEADAYPPRLWGWAARSAPSGDLTGMEPYELELAMRYTPLDGRLYAAMVAAGFIDDADGPRAIHSWMEHTGGAIAALAARAAYKRAWRALKARPPAPAPAQPAPVHVPDPTPVPVVAPVPAFVLEPTPPPEPPPPRHPRPVQTTLVGVPAVGYPPDFERLWKATGKSGNKEPAHRAWRKLGCPPADDVIAGWRRAEAHDRRWRDGGAYVPNLSTWLNARGWEDDPSQTRRRGSPVVAPRTAQTIAAMQEFVAAHTKGAP